LNHESLECRRLLTILPAGFTEELVGWASSASTMAIAPDGRVFVGQQHGHIEVIENDQQLDDPILELAVSEGGERGLLGITFDPQFESNNFLYVYYTTQDAPIHNRVSRFTMQGNSVIDGSEVSILDLEELGAINHNGGGIHFGSDDMLYVAVGDNAVSSNSQSAATRSQWTLDSERCSALLPMARFLLTIRFTRPPSATTEPSGRWDGETRFPLPSNLGRG
jgi:glucose/arabinose dehydrogenase